MDFMFGGKRQFFKKIKAKQVNGDKYYGESKARVERWDCWGQSRLYRVKCQASPISDI